MGTWVATRLQFTSQADSSISDDPVDWLYQKDDDLMTLDGNSEHDFDNDGVPEPASANYTFERR